MSNQAFQIIPAIDLLEGKCVRLQQGDYDQETVYSENPASQGERWQAEGAQRLHLVDLDGAKEGYPVNLSPVEEITSAISIPCEFGGGIRCIHDAKEAFSAGVDRVILGTAACEYPELVEMMVAEFGGERIVIGIDAREGEVASHGWIEDTGINALELAAKYTNFGIHRFIYTDISTDGMLSGPNLEAIGQFCDQIMEAQIIASGGISSVEDVKKLVSLGKSNLEGVIVGKALYDGQVTLAELLAVVAVE